MSEDLTAKFPTSNGKTLKQILDRVEQVGAQCRETNMRLVALEQKVDERLFDTRPIWEKMASDIAELKLSQQHFQEQQQHFEAQQQQFQERQQGFEGSLARLEESMELLRADSRDIRTHIRDIFRRLSIFNDTLVTMQGDYRDIYDRVRGLELRGT